MDRRRTFGESSVESSRKVFAVGHNNEFGIKRIGRVGRKFVPFPHSLLCFGPQKDFPKAHIDPLAKANLYEIASIVQHPRSILHEVLSKVVDQFS